MLSAHSTLSTVSKALTLLSLLRLLLARNTGQRDSLQGAGRAVWRGDVQVSTEAGCSVSTLLHTQSREGDSRHTEEARTGH
jgi:hypothetical protein